MGAPRLLIVDDRPGNRYVADAVLREHLPGCGTTGAGDAEEAWARLRDEAFDCALVDLQLPGMDGIELCRRIKGEPATARIPVVIITSHASTADDRARALAAGAEDFLSRPLDNVELIARVRVALRVKEAEDNLRARNAQLDEIVAQRTHDLRLRQAIDQVFLSVPEEDVFRAVREIVIDSLSSEHGVFGYMVGDGDLVCPSRHQERKLGSGEVEHEIIPRVVWKKEWLKALTDGQPVVNGANGDSSQGRPTDTFTAAVPIVHASHTIGLLEVTRSDCSYDESDVRTLSLIAEYVAPVLAARLERDRQRRRRDRAETALRESEARFRLLYEAAPLAYQTLDVGHRILGVNDAWLELLGHDRDSVRGHEFDEFVDPEDIDRVRVDLSTLLETGRVRDCEYTLVRADGARVLAILDGRVAVSPEGEKRVHCIIRDVTEQRDLEVRLRSSQKLEAVGRLAGGVAHDFNNLLTVIGGYADLLQNDLSQHEAAARRVKEIQTATARAAALTSQLLAFGRRQVLRPTDLDLGELISDLAGMLRRLIREDIDLVVEGDAEPVLVHADRARTEQALVNLVINARDAMPDGGTIRVVMTPTRLDPETAAFHDVSPGSFVRLKIVDTGTGMDAATLSHVFEPFFTTKGPEEGTGLGLPTVYGAVRQSGGAMAIDSRAGEGTTVTIWLPGALGTEVATPETAPPRTIERGREAILLVEDEVAVRDLLTCILEDAGYEVLTAVEGEEALTVCAREQDRIALVLTDVVMPGMGGPELARRLREQCPGLAIAFMSGYASGSMEVSDELPPDALLIEKPFGPADLTRHVREALDARQTA